MVGEIHCHTYFSLPKWIHRQLPSPFELIDHAISIGLDFLAITDHDSQAAFSVAQEYALSRNFVLIPSVEVSAKSSKLPYKRPHILAYGVPEKIPSRKSIPMTIDLIHQQGGLAVAAHPYSMKYSKALYIGDNVKKYEFDGVEVFNSDEDADANHQSLLLANELHCLQFVGSDAHCLENVGNSYIDIAIDHTLDWHDLILYIRQGKYSLVKTEFNPHDGKSKHVKSSSISFIVSSLKGKAS